MKTHHALLFILFLSFNAIADTTKEIQHLLSYVKSTECQYERNGNMHSGIEAVAHIQKKYDYYYDDIKTTEDFIEYSASQSKLSGRSYQIHCVNQPTVTSREWLLLELALFRSTRG